MNFPLSPVVVKRTSMGGRRFFALQCTVALGLFFATACPQWLDDNFERTAGAGGTLGNSGTGPRGNGGNAGNAATGLGGSGGGSGPNAGAGGDGSAEAGAAAVAPLPENAADASADGAAPAPTPCPDGVLGPGATCYYLITSLASWSDARQACLDAGRVLVKIDSAEEDTFIATLSPWSFWTGASDTAVDGSFVWSDGSPIVFSNWGLAQPDAYAGPDCVEKREGDELWYDLPCDSLKRYICEAPAG